MKNWIVFSGGLEDKIFDPLLSGIEYKTKEMRYIMIEKIKDSGLFALCWVWIGINFIVGMVAEAKYKICHREEVTLCR